MLKISARNYPIIEQWVEPGSRVLDLGCGDGSLLEALSAGKDVEGIGVEISHDMVLACIRKGLCVYQADIDRDLSAWEDSSFDYVVLNATLQVITRPYRVIEEMLRVGKSAIISITNFGHLRNRMSVLTRGMVDDRIRFSGGWHDTPVLRFVSIREFVRSLKEIGVAVTDARYFYPFNLVSARRLPLYNLLATEAIFKLRHA